MTSVNDGGHEALGNTLGGRCQLRGEPPGYMAQPRKRIHIIKYRRNTASVTITKGEAWVHARRPAEVLGTFALLDACRQPPAQIGTIWARPARSPKRPPGAPSRRAAQRATGFRVTAGDSPRSAPARPRRAGAWHRSDSS